MLTSKTGSRFFKKIQKKLFMNNVRKFSNNKRAVILGIETSCDDTGCAIVDNDGVILGEALRSQHSVHLKLVRNLENN